LFIETDAPLDEGIELRLRFSLPDGGQNFDIAGRVAWCRRPADRHGQTSGMGIEFTERECIVALALELERL
jgi:Tfp pilus assembly protein PilZ